MALSSLSTAEGLHMLDLVDDILYVIIGHLLNTSSSKKDPYASLGFLSTVCRRWRVICMPSLFRESYHRPLQRGLTKARILPPPIWVHIRSDR
jgi:hypothetical protein